MMIWMRAGQLEDLFVVQGARGRKVGKALVDALVTEGEKRGWQRIAGWCREAARPATRQRLAEVAAG
jgi:GNAT superfamily N-acetyltransferase